MSVAEPSASTPAAGRSDDAGTRSAEADIEDAQDQRSLDGNAAILARVESLEFRILDLDRSILAALSERRSGADGPPAGER